MTVRTDIAAALLKAGRPILLAKLRNKIELLGHTRNSFWGTLTDMSVKGQLEVVGVGKLREVRASAGTAGPFPRPGPVPKPPKPKVPKPKAAPKPEEEDDEVDTQPFTHTWLQSADWAGPLPPRLTVFDLGQLA